MENSILSDKMNDPLDNDNFDPIQYINDRFPTEDSLNDLDTFLLAISAKISTLDEELSKAIQSQSITGVQASREMIMANEAINELFTKIQDIKSEASQSEQMVQEICYDIKKLDYAKNHLQFSITMLKRLQMMMTAVDQLELLMKDFLYADIANMLDAVKQLMVYFDEYLTIPMISDIKNRIDSIQNDLKKNIQRIFREIGQLVDNITITGTAATPSTSFSLPQGLTSSILSDLCRLIDVLGYQFRGEILDEFIQIQLVPYEKIFGNEKQYFTLDNVERRWPWFKRLIKSYDDKFQTIFPNHWKVSLRLCYDFYIRTKSHIVALLTSLESKNSIDVHLLLKALQSTIRFESEINSKYELSDIAHLIQLKTSSLSSMTNPSLLSSPVATKSHGSDNQQNKEQQDELKFLKDVYDVLKSGLSDSYDNFLNSYVLLERSNLEEMLEKLNSDEEITGNNSEHANGLVYGSSIAMFAFIKNSIKRCTALTNGQTFLALTKEFKTCMQKYAELLRSRCPIAMTVNCPGQINPNTLAIGVSCPVYRLTPPSNATVGSVTEISICHVINTGEYCSEVIPQLEQMIRQKILETFVDKVDFNYEIDFFTDLIAYGLKVLVSGIMDRLDNQAFKAMLQVPWVNLTSVGEESQYCLTMHSILVECIPKIRETLSSSYYQAFMMKLVTEILSRYHDNIIRQKRISEMASQQLLLDTYNMKTLLLHMPHLSSTTMPGRQVPHNPSTYVKIVNTRITAIEVILKLIGTPEQLLVERFRVMWPEGQPSDLQTLMQLKGMKGQDQQSFLQGLGSAATNVASASSTAGAAAFSLASTARNAAMKWGATSTSNTSGLTSSNSNNNLAANK